MQYRETNENSFDPFSDDPLLTVEEAARYCKVSKTTINKWRRELLLPCFRVTSDARFRRSDLNNFIQEHRSWGWTIGGRA
jgi:excisionase family DNA binding protein